MRPSIDIPFELHGAVKDFAKKRGIPVSEGYVVLLNEGLDNDGGERR